MPSLYSHAVQFCLFGGVATLKVYAGVLLKELPRRRSLLTMQMIWTLRGICDRKAFAQGKSQDSNLALNFAMAAGMAQDFRILPMTSAPGI